MTWAGFGANGTTEIVFCEGRINSKYYQNMLQTYLLPIGPVIGGENYVFMQDNASVHKSKSTMEWLAKADIKVMEWPSRSPDLNPIENLWGILVRKVYKDGRQFSSISELKSAILDAWDDLGPETFQKLVQSMPNRVFEVIRANGGQTHY